MASILQVDPEPWPTGDGRPIANLTMSPEELGDRFGLLFEQDHDDLDKYVLAAIQRPSGGQLWLMRYQNIPSPGTTIYADASVSPCRAVAEIVALFGVEPADLSWVSGEN